MSFFTMTRTVIKNLLRKPFTIKYPFGPRRPYYPNTRGSITVNIHECIFCGLCQKKCLTAAITVSKEAKQWKIDRTRCIICGSCVEGCPEKCLNMENFYTPPSAGKKEDIYRNA